MSHLNFFKESEIMPKYRYLIVQGAFPDKVTPDIDFTDVAVEWFSVMMFQF